MIIHRMVQGTPEWLAVRAGIPTSSEFKNLISPKQRKVRTGEMPQTYLMTKLAERWLGRPMESFQAFGAVNQGKILEDEAIPALELLEGIDVERVGFVTDDAGKIGCSPDGLLTGGGCEIKCPQPPTHVEYLLGGVLPDDYVTQVQGSLLVTGLPEWIFMSHCPDFPDFILHVKRDEELIDILQKALDSFNEKLDKLYWRMVEINGGEPVRHLVTHETQGNVTTSTLAGVDPDELETFLESEVVERMDTL